ncbi:MAG: hypothetical protein DKM50_03075 [Candidatus Margulisiibacteriota bacterium]|nr:MAG: hypothetical protein A2X43_09820 [Candidatus Margulisbacteria bacterium GWD2_39_127]OGI04580.1 MAG: hypothetical protein A2X42_07710 [Candidatus Margulisbacteria bacterium GWF2_38_17]OGI11888.1 MAG: hypothetical protein A2X41_11560 [Candidatus Margulisbacteria bacterium GWE2_39_32]PZM83100.1 MAG: hypothetical protein DKM50_03075 [Candidatus Margulisiibacteriota bacterium]HAR62233.1 hypothetical protein [Candidatus Margulisiibacteriota bacterium]
MEKKYSRRELQGWGSVKHPIIREELDIVKFDVLPEISDEFSNNVERLVETVLVGLGFPKKQELDIENNEHLNICDMYEELEQAGLRYISSVKINRSGE